MRDLTQNLRDKKAKTSFGDACFLTSSCMIIACRSVGATVLSSPSVLARVIARSGPTCKTRQLSISITPRYQCAVTMLQHRQ